MAAEIHDKLRAAVLDGLTIDGDHHKQFFLWAIAHLVLSPLEVEMLEETTEPGVAP